MQEFKGTLQAALLELMRAHFIKAHEQLNKLGLYPGQPPVLFLLHHEDGQTQNSLAKATKLAPATITVMLQRMERAGLITRRADVTDSRVIRVYLTQRAQELIPHLQSMYMQTEAVCCRGISHEEKQQLLTLLSRVRDNLS